jgi:hypothetical protein
LKTNHLATLIPTIRGSDSFRGREKISAEHQICRNNTLSERGGNQARMYAQVDKKQKM